MDDSPYHINGIVTTREVVSGFAVTNWENLTGAWYGRGKVLSHTRVRPSTNLRFMHDKDFSCYIYEGKLCL